MATGSEGTVFGGRYVLQRQVGAGGMATVYLAHDRKHDRQVAVKVLGVGLPTAGDVQRFLREIRVAARLSHPGILALHDSGEEDGVPYYVMPFVEGPSLRDYLQQQGPLPSREAVLLLSEVCDALQYAHDQGVVHRDIKPANLLFSQRRLLIADFGIAKAIAGAPTESLTSTGGAPGTPMYMSPEQALGDRPIDQRADVYALGCVAYEMLTGAPPFSAPSQPAILLRHVMEERPSARAVVPSIPESLDDAIRRAMAIDPADRFLSAGEFARAAQESLGSEPLPEPGSQRKRAAWRRTVGLPGWLLAPRRRQVIMLALAVAVAGLASLWAVFGRDRDGGQPAADRSSALSPWVELSGENFTLIAGGDSVALLHRFRSPAVYGFGPAGWHRWSIPDGFEVRPFHGTLIGQRILATKRSSAPDGTPLAQLWWLDARDGTLMPVDSLGRSVPDEGQPFWWTDGSTVVTWLRSVERYAGQDWVREATGTAAQIRTLWGSGNARRFALADEPPDSILAFDGISWQQLDPYEAPDSARNVFSGGASLEDGSAVLFGTSCLGDSVCVPLLLVQRRAGDRWARVGDHGRYVLPATDRARDRTCTPELTLRGASGESYSDFLVWGHWSWCPNPARRRATTGCPMVRPCAWHVRSGRLEVADGLDGRQLLGAFRVGGIEFVLSNDGVVWRHVGGVWRAIDQVPDLPERRVAASMGLVAMFSGHRFTYQPPAGDSGTFFIAPFPDGPESSRNSVPPRRLLASDSVLVLLSGDQDAYTARCSRVASGTQPTSTRPRCGAWSRLPRAPEPVFDVAVLSEGEILAVGSRGLAWAWRGGRGHRVAVPSEVRNDTLRSLFVARDGQAWALGSSHLLRRDGSGAFSLVRRLSRTPAVRERLVVMPDGEVVVVGDWIRVWSAVGEDSLPAAVLHRPALGEPRVGAAHVLPDGRLVVGFAVPDEPRVGGWLQVWTPPISANRSFRVALPRAIDVTDLADDGSSLYVVGRGGMVGIALSAVRPPEPAGPNNESLPRTPERR